MDVTAEKSKSLTDQMQEKLTDGLNAAFDHVHEAKHAHYLKNPQSIPTERDIGSLIRVAVTQNAAISGGASLIPGPWGMLAVVPELLLVIRSQIGLIYDIGAAYGKKDAMSKELALGIFISAVGSSAGSLLVIHGGKVLVKRASLQVMQKLIILLGGRITQQAIKSAVSKWLPGVGAAAMAVWTGYLTKQIGAKAQEIMKQQIEQDGVAALDVDMIEPLDVAMGNADESAGSLAEYGRLQVLIDLAKVDGNLSDTEREALELQVEVSECTQAQRLQLRVALDGASQPLQGLDEIAGNPEAAISLLSAMVSFARKDGKVHITEKLYIKRIAGLLGFSAAEVDEFLAAE